MCRSVSSAGRACLLVAVALLVGCESGEDPLIGQMRQSVLRDSLEGEPRQIAGLIADWPADTDSLTVTIAGRIYGGDLDPFNATEASFSIIELPEPGHEHDDPGDCPFCKRKADNAAVAMVQVTDANGAPVKVPADKLLGLERNQAVAVTGTATRLADMVIVNATAIEALTKEKAVAISQRFQSEMSGADGPQNP